MLGLTAESKAVSFKQGIGLLQMALTGLKKSHPELLLKVQAVELECKKLLIDQQQIDEENGFYQDQLNATVQQLAEIKAAARVEALQEELTDLPGQLKNLKVLTFVNLQTKLEALQKSCQEQYSKLTGELRKSLEVQQKQLERAKSESQQGFLHQQKLNQEANTRLKIELRQLEEYLAKRLNDFSQRVNNLEKWVESAKVILSEFKDSDFRVRSQVQALQTQLTQLIIEQQIQSIQRADHQAELKELQAKLSVTPSKEEMSELQAQLKAVEEQLIELSNQKLNAQPLQGKLEALQKLQEDKLKTLTSNQRQGIEIQQKRFAQLKKLQAELSQQVEKQNQQNQTQLQALQAEQENMAKHLDDLNNRIVETYTTVRQGFSQLGGEIKALPGRIVAEQQAVAERKIRYHVDYMAARLKKHYASKGKITTLLTKQEQPISEINLSIVNYESKPYKSKEFKEEESGDYSRGDAKNLRNEIKKDSAEFLEYYESLHVSNQLISVADIFNSHIEPATKNKTQLSFYDKDQEFDSEHESDDDEKESSSEEDIESEVEQKFIDSDKENLDDEKIKHLLILGVAGTGKTTMSQYFAYQWASEGLWREKFDYLFWLPLRNLRKEGKEENRGLAAVIYRECLETVLKESKDIQDEKESVIQAIQYLFKTQSSRILLVLDGYDEIGHLMGDVTHPVYKVMQEAIKAEYFILTSRPYHLYHLGTIDRYLENIGFSNENIQAYVQRYFSYGEIKEAKEVNSSQYLLKFLQTIPALWGMVHIPINLSLICEVWRQGQHSDLFTREMTVTQLYQLIIEHLLEAYLRKRLGSELSIYNATSDWLKKQCVAELAFLETIAYEALQRGQINLTATLQQKVVAQVSREQESAIGSYLRKPLFDAVLEMGLLRIANAGQGKEIQKEHYFTHLIFQEFFAACYLIKGLQQEKSSERYQQVVKFIQENKYQSRYQVMLGFVAGLLSMNKEYSDSPPELFTFWNILLASPLDLVGRSHLRLIIRCLEESGCDKSIPQRDKMLRKIAQWAKSSFCYDDLEGAAEVINKDSFNWIIPLLQQAPQVVICSGLLTETYEILEGKNEQIKKAAVKLLGRLGEKITDPYIIKILIKILSKKSEIDVSIKAAIDKNLSASVRRKFTTIKKTKVLIEKIEGGEIGQNNNVSLQVAAEETLKRLNVELDIKLAAAKILSSQHEQVVSLSIIKILLKILKEKEEEPEIKNAVSSLLRKLGIKIKDKQIVDFLLSEIVSESEDWRIIKNLILTIGNLGKYVVDSKIIQVLLGKLNDRKHYKDEAEMVEGRMPGDIEVRMSAAHALGKLCKQMPSHQVLQVIIDILMLKDEKVWTNDNQYENEYSDEDEEHYRNRIDQFSNEIKLNLCQKILYKYVKQSLDVKTQNFLLDVLENDDVHISMRIVAIGALGWLGRDSMNTEVVVSTFLKMLVSENEDKEIIEAIIAALVYLGKNIANREKITEVFLKMLEHKQKNLVSQVTKGLGELWQKTGNWQVVEALRYKILKNKNQHESVSAIRALGSLCNEKIVEDVNQILKTVLEDKKVNSIVGSNALWEIGCFIKKGMANEKWIQYFFEKLTNKDCEISVEKWLENLAGKELSQRLASVAIKMLIEGSNESKEIAAKVLGLLGEKITSDEAISNLLGLLKKQRDDIKIVALKALKYAADKLVGEEMRLVLRATLDSKDEELIEASVTILEQLNIKPFSVGTIESLLKIIDGDYSLETVKNKEIMDARVTALKTLAHWGEKVASPEVIRVLLKILDLHIVYAKSNEEGSAFSAWYGNFYLLDYVRVVAAEVLGELGVKAASLNVIELLLECSSNRRLFLISSSCKSALLKLADKILDQQVIDILLKALADDYKSEIAASVLHRLSLTQIISHYIEFSSYIYTPPYFLARLAFLRGISITCTGARLTVQESRGMVEFFLPAGERGKQFIRELEAAFHEVAAECNLPVFFSLPSSFSATVALGGLASSISSLGSRATMRVFQQENQEDLKQESKLQSTLRAKFS